jgi:hypothetical protein
MTLPLAVPHGYRRPMSRWTPTNPFAALAAEVLPHQTSARLARLVDVGHRTAQKWVSTGDAPDDVWATLRHQRELLETHAPGPAMSAIATAASMAGLHPEVAAASIAMAYEQVVGREIE